MTPKNAHISALVNHDHVKYIRRKNTDSFRLKYSLGHAERRTLIREVSIHGLVLFEYYLRLASTENTPITDEAAAEYFDWSVASAKRHRLALTKAGWYACEKARLNNGRRVQVHYLGKDEVSSAGLKPSDLPVDGPADTPKQTLFITKEGTSE